MIKTIYILWLREVKKYFRSKSRIIGSLGQPLLFMIALGFGFGSIYEKAGGGNYLEFLVPGIIAMSILFTAVFSGIEIIWDRKFGFLKETLVAPVSRFEIMIGRSLGGATVAVFQGILVLIISFFIGFRIENYSMILLAIVFMFMIALLFTALGTAIASSMEDMQGFQLIMNFLIMPIFFLSGSLFPLNELPNFLQKITYFNPLSYGIDGLRGVLVNTVYFSISTDIVVLGIIIVLLNILGGYLFSKIQI
ncbi:MAG: ABC transporter permease [Candidatus Pacebacteria bacterium]|nr:ABC transporter permease [Candidatus Paceibacterota bacterium]MDD5013386.1 ABC transporter permease [Candidatus Paceibacterota bacterium]MDD5752730.1 ABC transporter permease [Candidatus Paceibacterota bacterium]